MVDVHAGHDGDIRIDDVDRIEAAAQSDFENQRIEAGACEQPQRGQRAELEIRQRHRRAVGVARREPCVLDGIEGLDQLGIGRIVSGDAHPLVVAKQMRRRVEPDPISGTPQHRVEQRARGSLAVGAGDRDHGTADRRREVRVHGAHAVQSHRDGLRVQRFEKGEPGGQRRGAAHAKPGEEVRK